MVEKPVGPPQDVRHKIRRDAADLSVTASAPVSTHSTPGAALRASHRGA